jgi:hypothetical protein
LHGRGRLQQATEQSTLILKLQIDDIDLQQDVQQGTTISVNAEAEIVDIMKSEGPLSIGDVDRRFLVPNHIELHSQQAIQTVELSEVARVDVGEDELSRKSWGSPGMG